LALTMFSFNVGASAEERPPRSCAVAYRITDGWGGGFNGSITIINTGDAMVDGWTLRWTFADGQVATNVWDGVAVSNGPSVSVRSMSANAVLPPAGTVMFGFTGSSLSRNTPPQAFTLNSVACTLA
jgi:mannan endo-1,4-beta-mannosidase